MAALALLCGCQTDNRISWSELSQMEATAKAEVKPVEVEPQTLRVTELEPYTLGAGDIVQFNMIGLAGDGYSDVPVTARVHTDGTVALPLVGRLKVGGLTLEQTEQAVFDAYVPKFVKALSVYAELTGPETTTVVISGAVTTPGPVSLPRNERNVLYALARGGGFGALSGSRVHVQPINPAQPEVTYDLTSINDLRRLLTATPLHSGDMLVVEPTDNSVIYTTGLFNTPGPVAVARGSQLSLVRTVAASGGLRDWLEPKEGTLWRRLPDGRQVRVKIDLASILSGEEADIALLPGDVLDVPHTADTRFRQWFAENIRFGPFGVTAVYDPVSDYRARILSNQNNNNDNGLQRTLLDALRTGVPNVLIPPVRVAQ